MVTIPPIKNSDLTVMTGGWFTVLPTLNGYVIGISWDTMVDNHWK